MEKKINKRVYKGSSSPKPFSKLPNNLTHLLNISSKFTGTGGSKYFINKK